MPWVFVCESTRDSPALIGGVNVASLPWSPVQRRALQVGHPRNPERYLELRHYQVLAGNRAVEFAAAELSPGSWIFYRFLVPSPQRKRNLLVLAGAFVASGLVALPFRHSVAAQVLMFSAALGFLFTLEALAAHERSRDDVV